MHRRLNELELHALDHLAHVAGTRPVAEPADGRAPLAALGAGHRQHVDAFADDVDAGL